jgi:RNA polymerase sigma factor (sigma-70 family)
MKLSRSVSKSLNFKNLFQGWEIAVAKRLIKKFQRQWTCLREEDFDDLLQECLTHWLFSRDSYDPSHGALKKTFMGRVVENKLIDIVREREADKRKTSYHTISIDEPLEGTGDDAFTVLDKIDADRASETPHDPPETQLSIDLSRAWERLTPRQRKLCQVLKEGYTMEEASEILKTPRTTLYDEKERIKTLFSKKNLRDYLY